MSSWIWVHTHFRISWFYIWVFTIWKKRIWWWLFFTHWSSTLDVLLYLKAHTDNTLQLICMRKCDNTLQLVTYCITGMQQYSLDIWCALIIFIMHFNFKMYAFQFVMWLFPRMSSSLYSLVSYSHPLHVSLAVLVL